MEQWVPTMESVAKKARVLPDGLKDLLRDMLKVGEVERLAKVPLLLGFCLAEPSFCSSAVRPLFKSSTPMHLRWPGA
jgi:hypothetical protein